MSRSEGGTPEFRPVVEVFFVPDLLPKQVLVKDEASGSTPLVARCLGLVRPESVSRTRKFPALARLPRSSYPSLLALRLPDALGCLLGPDVIGIVTFFGGQPTLTYQLFTHLQLHCYAHLLL
jgi:hypothetical protein